MLPGETEYSPRFTDVDFANFEPDPEVKAIAFGVCQLFDTRKLCVASIYLQNPNGMDFVTTNDDPVFVAGPSGRLMPDVGATLASLETACGRKAERIGKPDKFAFGQILQDHFADEQDRWSDPEYLRQFCYVGDNIDTDVIFAKNSEIGSVLVLSGINKKPEEIERASPSFTLAKFSA